MHCGAIRGWGDCDCRCDSCGIRIVRTYTRYLNNNTECRRFMFWRKYAKDRGRSVMGDGNGQLMVREMSCDPGEWILLYVSYGAVVEVWLEFVA
jgi:hypothetical protein